MKYILTIMFFLAIAFPAFAATSSTTGWQKVTTGIGSNAGGISTGIKGIVVSAPTASPGTGGYEKTQSVTLSAPGAGAIHYMLNTKDPTLTCSNGTFYGATTSPISVSGSALLRVIACYGSGSNSTTTSSDFTYTFSSATPAPSSNGGGGGGSTTILPSTTPLIGDINGDGVVNILDFNALLVQWGKTGSDLSADLNHDGVVGILDFNILIIHWHQTTK